MMMTNKIRVPFRVYAIEEPRYGRYYFLEAWSIVRTLFLNRRREIERKTFRWDYRTIGLLKIPLTENPETNL